MFQKAVESGKASIADPEAFGISLMGALDGVLAYAIIHQEEDIDILAERLGKIWINKGRGCKENHQGY